MLYEIELSAGGDCMRNLHIKAKEILLPSRPFGFIWKVIIETAIAEPIDCADLRMQTPVRVNLQQKRGDPWLIESFHNPETLGGAPNLADFRIEGEGKFVTAMKTLVIRTVINKTVIVLLLVFTAVVACVIGVIVGLLTHKSEVGFGISCAVFTLITVV
ncbi:hypothetical protein K440DRAFT_642555 [Wilcoxina mikolae CBS 423.85]|nr:hypothetical protein K440DRAFT_642555 [Wilcoxina mikolae CBS 423.85]